MIMAGGTGGHIFPALAVARELQAQGLQVAWLGARQGMEAELVSKAGITLFTIAARGLSGKSLRTLITAPWMLLRSLFQALGILREFEPDCVLGMGGYVSGPGGIAARLSGIRLLVHEQNAVPGVTNKLLAPLAWRVMESFPGTFPAKIGALHTGNPLRQEIVALGRQAERACTADRPLHILVLGGSQGAMAINSLIPRILAGWGAGRCPRVRHQTGKANLQDTLTAYQQNPGAAELAEISGFIDDMSDAYGWADLVVGRSGATTVCELAAAAIPSILVPYPWHKDQQQLYNARWLETAGAAVVLPQEKLNEANLMTLLHMLDRDRARLQAMARAAGKLGITDAATRIAGQCREAAGV